jgi:hypothetical protein
LKSGKAANRFFETRSSELFGATQDEFAGHAPVADFLTFDFNHKPVAARVLTCGGILSNAARRVSRRGTSSISRRRRMRRLYCVC